MAQGVADAVIPHFVSTVVINPGSFTTSSGPVSGVGAFV